MIWNRVLLLSILFLSATLGADEASEEAAIIAMLQASCEAFQVGNVEVLEKTLDGRFTLTSSSGVVTTKAQELADVRRGEPKYEIFQNSEMRVRQYGDAAVITGITWVKGTAGGQPFEARLQFTDTAIKSDGNWRLAASHVSPARTK